MNMQNKSVGKGRQIKVLIAVGIAILLAVTNPSEGDFHRWVSSHAEPSSSRSLGETGFTLSWIETAGIVRYRSFAVFSFVEVRFDTLFGVFNPTGNFRRRFIGIADQWIPLDGPHSRYSENEVWD